MIHTLRALTPLVITLVAAVGCSPAAPGPTGPGPATDAGTPTTDGSSPPPGGDAASPAAANMIGCQRLKEGPFMPATGKVMFTYSDPGPAMDAGSKAYRLTLPDPPKAGHFGFKVPADGEWVIFASRSVAIKVFTWDGIPLDPKEAAGSVPECTQVKSREVYQLNTDSKPHVLRFGGDSAMPVDVVIVSARP